MSNNILSLICNRLFHFIAYYGKIKEKDMLEKLLTVYDLMIEETTNEIYYSIIIYDSNYLVFYVLWSLPNGVVTYLSNVFCRCPVYQIQRKSDFVNFVLIFNFTLQIIELTLASNTKGSSSSKEWNWKKKQIFLFTRPAFFLFEERHFHIMFIDYFNKLQKHLKRLGPCN